jgi:hypothetical protein
MKTIFNFIAEFSLETKMEGDDEKSEMKKEYEINNRIDTDGICNLRGFQ